MLETSVEQKPNSPYSISAMMFSILKWVSTTWLSAFCHLEGRGGGGFFRGVLIQVKICFDIQNKLKICGSACVSWLLNVLLNFWCFIL